MSLDGNSGVRKSILYIGAGTVETQEIDLYLGKGQYKILWGPNADEGVKMAQIYLPDLIMIDTKNSKFDGVDLIQQLRSYGVAHLTYVPIMVISEKLVDQKIKLEMKRAGCNYFIDKPINSRKLQATVLAITPR